ncbi:MAG: hypothetical protein ACKO37_07795 [Vampirovibrionales bacterium]
MMISFSGAKALVNTARKTLLPKAKENVREATKQPKGLLGKAKQLASSVFGKKTSHATTELSNLTEEASSVRKPWYTKKRVLIPTGTVLAAGGLTLTSALGKDKKPPTTPETPTSEQPSPPPLASQEPKPPHESATPPSDNTTSPPPPTTKPTTSSQPQTRQTATTSYSTPSARDGTYPTSYYAMPRTVASNGYMPSSMETGMYPYPQNYATYGSANFNPPSLGSSMPMGSPAMASRMPTQQPSAAEVGQGSGDALPQEMTSLIQQLLQNPKALQPPTPQEISALVQKDPEKNEFKGLLAQLPEAVQKLLLNATAMVADETGRLYMKLSLKGEGNKPGTTLLLNNQGDLTIIPQEAAQDPSKITHLPVAQDGGKALKELISGLPQQTDKLIPPSEAEQASVMAAIGVNMTGGNARPKGRFSGTPEASSETNPAMASTQGLSETPVSNEVLPLLPSQGIPTQDETRKLLLASRNPFQRPSMVSKAPSDLSTQPSMAAPEEEVLSKEAQEVA